LAFCAHSLTAFFVLTLSCSGIAVANAAILNGQDAKDALGQNGDGVSNPLPVYTKGTLNDAPNILGLSSPAGFFIDTTNHRLFLVDQGNNRVLVYNLDASTNALVDRVPDNVIGQADFHTSTAATTQAGLNLPVYLAYDSANNYLFVSQQTGNRVSIFNLSSGITNGMNAQSVLGQPDFTTTTPGNSQTGMNQPLGMTYDGVSKNLFVAQQTSNRVTVYNFSTGSLINDGPDATDMLGQYDDGVSNPGPVFTKVTANDAPNVLGLSAPGISGLALDTTNHRLFLSDSSNNRVLVYNLDSSNNLLDRIPDNVIGQADFHTSTAATTQAGLNVPNGLAYDSANNYLFVAQTTGNRVSVFDLSSGITNGMGAMNILGQPDFTTTTAANTQAGLNAPYGLLYDSTHKYLFISQFTGNRVSIFDLSAGIATGLNAVHILGQPSFVSLTAATTQTGMNGPLGLAYDSTNSTLFVGQFTGNRVTTYDLSSGITDGQNASHVLGQTNFTTLTATTTQTGMGGPRGIAYDNASKRLFVAQQTNNRVTIYDLTSGITDGQNAVNVLGQPTFTNLGAYTTQGGINDAEAVVYDSVSKRLFVAQGTSNRVTTYNLTSGITNGQNAEDVLGQYDDNTASPGPLFTKATANNAPSIRGLNAPNFGIALDTTNHRLFLSDSGNNRVLVYNLDTSNNLLDRIPDNVIGQADFHTVTAATTQAGLNVPNGLAYDSANKYLFVAQQTGNRVSVFNLSSGITNGMNAQNMLGQPDFTTTTAANTQGGMNLPLGITYDGVGKNLFVAQQTANRVTVYNFSGGQLINDGPDATDILGQYDDGVSNPGPIFTKATVNDAPNILGLSAPAVGILLDTTNHRLFLSDTSNNRVLVYNLDSSNNLLDRIPDNVIGQADFHTSTAATTQAGLNVPNGLAYDSANNYLFVAQTTGNRVSVFDLSSGITNGMGAMNILGQPDFTTTTPANTQAGLNAPYGLLYDSTHKYLFISQFTGNRVSIFDLSAGIITGINAFHVLGQSTFVTVTAATTQTGMNGPIGLAYDNANSLLFVSQLNGNRVTTYDLSSGITDGQNANHVLGQTTFTATTAATTQAGMNIPYGVTYDASSKRLFVPQSTGNRVTIYDLTSGITDGQNAINVLGQSTFTTTTVLTTQAGMRAPTAVAYDSGNSRLYVLDSTNNRVTTYNLTSGITDGQNAEDVLGQYDDNTASPGPLFTKATANNAPSIRGLNAPNFGIALDTTNHRLFLSDSGNNRVLVYNLDTSNNLLDRIPDNVIGQADFHTVTAATTQAGLNVPNGLAYDSANKYLFVAQQTGNRVSVFNLSSGITNGMSAFHVLGQANFTTTTAANTQGGMNLPLGITYDGVGKNLFVAQQTANRVTVYDLSAGIADGQNASHVLGQANFTTVTAATTQAGMNATMDVAYDSANKILFVSQTTGNRVTTYDLSAGITDGQNANHVLGQATFIATAAANTQVGMNAPRGIAYDTTTKRLFVSQLTANRVTVYDLTSGITDGQNAANVIGQASFTSATAANTQVGMNGPTGVVYDSGNNRLYVPQSTANRVSIYGLADVFTTGKAASHVLGQTNFTTVTAATTQAGMNATMDVAYDSANKILFVSQTTGNRVTTYDLSAGITDGQNANHVLGQATFTGPAASNLQAGMNAPRGISYDATSKRLFVSQFGGNRVTVYDLTSGITDGQNAANVIGQPTFGTATAANTQAGMNGPTGVVYDSGNNRLYVPQSTANRVSIYSLTNTNTLSVGKAASHVLGQANFTNITAATTQAGMNVPIDVTYDSANKLLFVSQSTGNRVTTYDLSSGITDGQNANHVLGQANFTATAAATTQVGMNLPRGVSYDPTAKRLFVAQATANRVTTYDLSSGITDGQNAANVLGQTNFTNATTATTQAGMNVPSTVAYSNANKLLFVSQFTGGNNVTIYNLTSGITNGQNAADALGQYDDNSTSPGPIFTKATINNAPSYRGLNGPFVGMSLDTVGHRLFLADTGNNRVLVYNLDSTNTLLDHIPDNVLGQPDFRTVAAATTQAGMNVPIGIAYDSANKYLFVGQQTANRVSVYDLSSGITNGQNAFHVLGQANFTATFAATTQAGMNLPLGIVYDSVSKMLFVAQFTGNRVTTYDLSSGITDGQNASHVLGQASFTDTSANTTQAGMNNPYDLTYDNTNKVLFVSNSAANRVTMYNLVAGITDGQNASHVLGQIDFIGAAAANSQTGMNAPRGIYYDSTIKRLFVSQLTANRVSVYDLSTTIIDGMPASNVIGQANFTNATAANTQSGMNGPTGVLYDPSNSRLYVPQSNANRVTIYAFTGSIAVGSNRPTNNTFYFFGF
jgi:DNA-binding beta-propeller fold protein YncE